MSTAVLWSAVVVVVVGIAVLAFAVYEVSWKLRRLRRDLHRWQQVASQVPQVQAQLADMNRTIEAIGRARSSM